MWSRLLLLTVFTMFCSASIAQQPMPDDSDRQNRPPIDRPEHPPRGERPPSNDQQNHRPAGQPPGPRSGPNADQSQAQAGNRPPRQRRGPPPEAYEACKDALLGQEVSILTPNGHLLPALCDYIGEDLVAIPLHMFEPEDAEQ